MSKAILVMDMPSSCEKCRLHSFVGKDCDVICVVKGKTQSYEEAYKSKPDWCPLRELPEKKMIEIVQEDYDGGYSHGFTHGYNDCIDELLKGEEG
jgi:hypothetical protein